MLANKIKKDSTLTRVLSIVTPVREGESLSVLLLFCCLFLLLFTVYLLKPAREMLILTEGGSELRSYSVALQAVLLIFLIPVYGKISRHMESEKLMRYAVLFFASSLCVLYLLGKSGVSISVVYFVWLGAYGVLIIAQFWAFASDVYNKATGERLFVIIALGATAGAWAGAIATKWLVNYFDAYGMILLGSFTLVLSSLPVLHVVNKIPEEDRVPPQSLATKEEVNFFDAFNLVLKNRYLLRIAIFVLLLNWLNSVGEFMVSTVVERRYDALPPSEVEVSKQAFIGQFYSTYFLLVNVFSVLIQLFLVSRLIKWLGLAGAFLVTPVVVLVGYGVLAFFPVLAIFRVVKISENSLDYSLQNTTRQMLFLPLSRREKYEGRAVTDSLFFRFGDLIQAFTIFIGLNMFDFEPKDFISINLVLACLMLLVAQRIVKSHSAMESEGSVVEAAGKA
jgi:AAA family ATP:ADP antiporter